MWYFHFDPENIRMLFRENRWEEILSTYSPAAVARELGLKNAIIVSQYLLTNGVDNVMLKDSALSLLYVIKGMFQSEWESDPQYEKFLKFSCYTK